MLAKVKGGSLGDFPGTTPTAPSIMTKISFFCSTLWVSSALITMASGTSEQEHMDGEDFGDSEGEAEVAKTPITVNT